MKPIKQRIVSGEFNRNPTYALNINQYTQWLGYAFERFCRKYYYVIAKILGFSDVAFKAGSYFSRQTNTTDPGYQIDLIFERQDKVYTLCEIKYKNSPLSNAVIEEFERKVEKFRGKPQYTLQRVLISNSELSEASQVRRYFDRVITLNHLFDERYWE
ncbi:MAG: hypothetical protein HY591_01415, partial [Candidatus Omnitrophica bacterium]|nr:hypothetical protein [Candidatus Omnitrophota bacterium]